MSNNLEYDQLGALGFSGSLNDRRYQFWDSGYIQRLVGVPTNVKEYGAVGDGSTDDATAIQSAIDAVEAAGGGFVEFPTGTYNVGTTLTIDSEGVVLRGQGGHIGQTELVATHTSGPVIRIKKRSCGVIGMKIDSDATRFAASVTDGHGIHYEGGDSAGVSMSRGYFEDLLIQRQPEDGFHVAGSFEFSKLFQITVADCVRHGFVLDDGTRSGRTNKDSAPFVFTLENCRAFECGGNALLIGKSGQTEPPQEGLFINFEALGCCWDSGERESLYQIESRCNGTFWINSDVEDQQYAATTTSSTGSTRTGNATPAHGFKLVGYRNHIQNPYFSSLLSSVDADTGDGLIIENPRIFQGAYGVDQADAIIVASSVTDFRFMGQTSQTTGATDLIKNQSVGADIRIDGKRYKGINLTAFDFEIESSGTSRTVSSGTLEIQEDVIFVQGEGDTTDSITTLRLQSGTNGFDGLKVSIINPNTYTVTLNHGTGNMQFAAGANKALTQDQAVTMIYSETASAWIEI